MPFEPGQSGNPAGRVKDAGYLRQTARLYAEQAIGVLVSALEDEDTKVRIKAAEVLLDRGWGKPSQTVDLGNADGKPFLAAIEHRIVDPLNPDPKGV
jgi:hypothetical protein